MHVFVTHSSPVTKEKGDRRERGKSRREKGHSGTVAPGMRMFSISFPSRSSSGTQELFLRVSDALSFRGPVANGQERKGPDVLAPEVFAFEPLASFGGWRAQYVRRPICRLACGITGGCMDSPCVGRHQSFSNGMPDEHLKMKTSKNLTLVFQISTSLGFLGLSLSFTQVCSRGVQGSSQSNRAIPDLGEFLSTLPLGSAQSFSCDFHHTHHRPSLCLSPGP